MVNQNSFSGSLTVRFIVKNNLTNKTLTVFGQTIAPNASYDLMKIPGITEDDIRSDLTKGSLRKLVKGGLLTVVSSTVNLSSPDVSFGSFLSNASVPTSLTNPSYLTQANWYVDPTLGNDANDGLTSGTAIKTLAELSRRWGKGNKLTLPTANTGTAVYITVNILGSIPASDPLEIDVILDGDVRLLFLGGVATSTPLTVSSVTPRNRATNTPWQITATGGLTVGERIYDSTVNAYFWAVKDQGSNVFRVSEPTTKPALGSLVADANQVSISNSDTFVMQTLYTIKLGSLRVTSVRSTSGASPFAGSHLMFRDLNFTGDYAPELSGNGQSYAYECKFSKGILIATGAFNNIQNCSQPTGQLIRISGSLTRFYSGGFIGNGSTFTPTSCTLQFANDVLFQGQSMSIIGGVILAILGTAAIFDSVAGGNGGTNTAGNGLLVTQGGSAILRGATANLWGSGQLGGGVGVASGSTFYYTNNPPTITGSTPGTNDFVLGESTSTYGINADGTLVGPTTNSWANFAAAIGAGTGFGGFATNPQKQASIIKTQ